MKVFLFFRANCIFVHIFRWRVIEEDRRSAVETTDAANVRDNTVTAKTDGDETLGNVVSEIVNETSTDTAIAKANEDAKEQTEQALSIEKTTATMTENITEGSEKLDVTKEALPTDEADTSKQIDITIIHTPKLLEHKKNNVLSKVGNVSAKIENENITTEKTTFAASLEEPVAKKRKYENSPSFAEGTTSSHIETVDNDTTGEINRTETESILTLKCTVRLKRSVTIRKDNFGHDATVEEEANEIEDISDETIKLRHERALVEERRKFQTYLKYPWSTRSRANRRIDSRAESSGANTPDPTSPAPQTASLSGGDHEVIIC